MGKWRLVGALGVVAMVAAGADHVIVAGKAKITATNPTYPCPRLETAANGKVTTMDFRLSVASEVRDPINALLVMLEDSNGRRLAAGPDSRIHSVRERRFGADQKQIGAIHGSIFDGKDATSTWVFLHDPLRRGANETRVIDVRATTAEYSLRVSLAAGFRRVDSPGQSRFYVLAGTVASNPQRRFAIPVPAMKPNCGIVVYVEPTGHSVRRGTFRLVGKAPPAILGVEVIGASEVFDVVRHSENRGFRIVGDESKARPAMQLWIRLKGELRHDAALVGRFLED